MSTEFILENLSSAAAALPPPAVRSGPGSSERRFLFVTAPFGPFSRRLAQALRKAGAACDRVLLNAGDVSEWGFAHAVPYRGSLEEWPSWIADHLQRARTTDVILHGDSHPYGRVAIEAATVLGLRVHVLEEGYCRPHWITLERGGVNARSSLPRTRSHYEGVVSGVDRAPTPVGKITPAAIRHITRYHLCSYLGWPLFPRYRNPYSHPVLLQAFGHVRRYFSQRLQRRRLRARLDEIFAHPGPLFLALLQRPGDSQLTRHSEFGRTLDFIEYVITSFAAHASDEMRLLFKSHPLDHGLERHAAAVRSAAGRAGVADRVFFVDDGHFPTILRASSGVICVNSTGGLAALELGLPTIALGEAIYGMPGMTHQGGLDSFWTTPQTPDRRLVASYQAVLLATCQINGAFSTRHGIVLALPETVRKLLGAEFSSVSAVENGTFRAALGQTA